MGAASRRRRFAERADAFSERVLGCKPVLSSSRLILSLKRLDRWREVPHCFQEFEQPTALLASYLGLSDIVMPTVAQHRSGLRLRVNELGDLEAIWRAEFMKSGRRTASSSMRAQMSACLAATRRGVLRSRRY